MRSSRKLTAISLRRLLSPLPSSPSRRQRKPSAAISFCGASRNTPHGNGAALMGRGSSLQASILRFFSS